MLSRATIGDTAELSAQDMLPLHMWIAYMPLSLFRTSQDDVRPCSRAEEAERLYSHGCSVRGVQYGFHCQRLIFAMTTCSIQAREQGEEQAQG